MDRSKGEFTVYITTENTTGWNAGYLAIFGETAMACADCATTYDTPTLPAVEKPVETGPLETRDLDKAASTHDYSALVSQADDICYPCAGNEPVEIHGSIYAYCVDGTRYQSTFEVGHAWLGDAAPGIDSYMIIHGRAGVPLIGTGHIETVGTSGIGESRACALEITWTETMGISLENAILKDATSMTTGDSGVDGVIHQVSEPVGDMAEDTITVSCTITLNTVAEVGVKRVSPVVDEKMVDHRGTVSMNEQKSSAVDLDVVHVCMSIHCVEDPAFASVRLLQADNTQLAEMRVGIKTDEAPTGLRINGCSEDSTVVVETSKGYYAVFPANSTAILVSI